LSKEKVKSVTGGPVKDDRPWRKGNITLTKKESQIKGKGRRVDPKLKSTQMNHLVSRGRKGKRRISQWTSSVFLSSYST